MPRPAVNDPPGGYLPFGFGRVSTVVVFGFAWAFLTVMNRPLPASRPILVEFDATCLTSFRSGGKYTAVTSFYPRVTRMGVKPR